VEMIKGLFNNMVLQRNVENECEAKFSLKFTKNGTFKVYVFKEGIEFSNYSIIVSGKTNKHEIHACIKGLPVGGPYDMKLSVENSEGKALEYLTIRNVLVGDVWILAGQSNMHGVGYMKYSLKPDPMVRAFYMTDHWDIAKDPLHIAYKAVDDVHTKILGAVKLPSHLGVGPGVSFGLEMHKLTGVPQGLVSCAHGATSMSQWDPGLKNHDGGSLYGAMIRRFMKNGGKIAGVLWYQGCSDTFENDAPVYASRAIELVKSMRKDFNNSQLPVVAVQISRVCITDRWQSPKYWNAVQEQQRLLPDVIRNFSIVPAIDLSLDDNIHISGYDQNRLGKRLSQAMISLMSGTATFLPPIRLKNIKKVVDRYNKCINIVITYENVMGQLESSGRPAGFSLIKKDSEVNVLSIYRTDLLDNKVIIKTFLTFDQFKSLELHYGYGFDPYCNITDSCDRSIPVMGPIDMDTII
jgi:hypothetical protein